MEGRHVQVVDGVFTAAHIEGVAIGEEGDTSQALHHIGHHLHIIGAKVGQISFFPKVELQSGEAVGEINVFDAGGADELFQLPQKVGIPVHMEVGIVDFGRIHGILSFAACCVFPIVPDPQGKVKAILHNPGGLPSPAVNCAVLSAAFWWKIL